MSLMVHLPLNGDLKNNGLLDIIVTNHGATVENNGKIGKCYAFDNNTSYIALQHINLYSILNGAAQPFSICFWVYQADASRAIIFGDYSVSGGNNFNIELTTGHTLRWYWGTPDFSISAMNVGQEVWAHVAFTYDGTTLKGYINGQLKYTGTYTFAAKGRTAGEYYLGRDGRTGTTTLNGRLNDFRIYNHCLSPKEVHEISKGLVGSYPLDDNSLIDGIGYDSSGYGHHGIINGTMTTDSNKMRHSKSGVFNGSDNAIKIPFNDMIKNKNYTISVWTYKTSIGTKNYQTILGGPSGFELEARSGATADPLYRIYNWGGGTTSYEFNKWNLFTFVHTDSDSKLYVNGELKITGSSANIPTGNYYIGAWSSVTGQNYEGKMSDFRIYATALSADDVKELYNTPAMIDNEQNLYAYEFVESTENRELLNSVLITSSFSDHTTPINNSKYINGELTFTTNGSSAGSPYIPITPSGHVYKYDIEFSVNAGNQFDIGFERYDQNKTPRSNNACAYVYATKSTTNLSHKRIKGTVNLSTDGTNPCAFIALRILNGWSGTDSGVTGTATIHRLSLQEVSSTVTTTINKQGICVADSIYEDTETIFYDNGYIESNQFIEY